MEVLNFHFRNQSYCIEIARISEVLDSASATVLPGAPPAFDGIFQVRGKIINLLNFSRCFGNESETEETAILVFASPMEQFAIKVPGALEVRSLEFNQTRFPREAGGIVCIVEGTVSDGEKIHHLISLDRLLAHATEMVEAWRAGE